LQAPPAITSERLAKVPQPYGLRSVSPEMTSIFSGATGCLLRPDSL